MFDAVVSLGAGCNVAGGMAKYGCRSFSGPFDWLVTSEFDWVLHYLENDFADFILRNNMVENEGNRNEFRDKESGFLFLHDNEYDLSHYDSFRKKYERRIERLRLMRDTGRSVLYLRTATSEESYWYQKNKERIQKIIKVEAGSELILLTTDNQLANDECLPFRTFKINEPKKDVNRHHFWRNWFDGSEDLVQFLTESISGFQLYKNLAFDLAKEQKNLVIVNQRYINLLRVCALEDLSWFIGKELYIYGAGHVGKQLYRKIRDVCTVRGFIDRSKSGGVSGTPIYHLDALDKNLHWVVVTPTYEFAYIQKECQGVFCTDKIISLDQVVPYI